MIYDHIISQIFGMDTPWSCQNSWWKWPGRNFREFPVIFHTFVSVYQRVSLRMLMILKENSQVFHEEMRNIPHEKHVVGQLWSTRECQGFKQTSRQYATGPMFTRVLLVMFRYVLLSLLLSLYYLSWHLHNLNNAHPWTCDPGRINKC